MPRLLLTASLAALSACATAPMPEPVFEEAAFFAATALEEPAPQIVEVVETAVPLPLPGQMKPLAQGDTSTAPALPPDRAVEEGRSGALIEPSLDGFVNAVQVYPYTEGALYRLYTSPGQVSDIALQPGEMLVSVSAGDTVRWVVGDTVSGSGASARAHVLVKPVSAGLRTNLMIATDRRTYHLELQSTPGSYMAALSWRYPQDELAALAARNRNAAEAQGTTIENALSLDTLSFNYRISGDRPAWTPVRVFDDGRQVFIQMPEGTRSSNMPPLFVTGTGGRAELVNYRVRGSWYIVDRLFEAAELRLGERPQTVVRITKESAPRPRSRLFGG